MHPLESMKNDNSISMDHFIINPTATATTITYFVTGMHTKIKIPYLLSAIHGHVRAEQGIIKRNLVLSQKCNLINLLCL